MQILACGRKMIARFHLGIGFVLRRWGNEGEVFIWVNNFADNSMFTR